MNRPTFANVPMTSKTQANLDLASDERTDENSQSLTQNQNFASKEKLPKRSLIPSLEKCTSKESNHRSALGDCMSETKPQGISTTRTAPLPTYYQSPTGNIYPRGLPLGSAHGSVQTTTAHFTQMKSKHCSVSFAGDEDIFPSLDFRKCTRCGKNDALSPGFCVYQTTCAETDSVGMIVLKHKDRVAQTHAYCKEKEESASSEGQGDSLCIKKENRVNKQTQQRDVCVQTVIGLSEIRSMSKGRITEYKQVDPVFLSPKEFR